MKDCKFRAWIPDIERMYMVYSIDTDHNGKLPKTVTVWEHPCYKSAVIKNKRGTFILGSGVQIMQYSGLKDKNGVEIYEGDICSYTCNVVIMSNAVEMFDVEPQNNFQVEEDGYELKYIGEVRVLASKGAVLANCKVFKDSVLEQEIQRYKDIKCSKLRVEVIGNIYENPELLKD